MSVSARSRISPGQGQFRLRTLILAMLLAGPLSLLGREAAQEFELQRERANRTQCTPGLKQISLSLHNYHDLSRHSLSPKRSQPAAPRCCDDL